MNGKNAARAGRRNPKNDNLSRYKESMVERNEALVRRSVEHIVGIGGVPTFSLVSRVTYDLADREAGEKGLTAAALSKNPLYREIILGARESAESSGRRGGHASGTGRLADGDARMALHSLRIENAKLRRDNAILKDRLSRKPTPEPSASPLPQKLLDECAETRRISKSFVYRLMELELALVDERSGNLVLANFGDVLLKKEALELLLNSRKEKL